MGSSVLIRYAGPEDIPVIGFLAQQIWPQTYGSILSGDQLDYMMRLFYSPDSLLSQMQEKHHQFIIIEDEEEPLGFASFSAIPPTHNFKLHKIYVLPGQQGKGLGKLIIDFVIEEIRPRQAAALQLNVNRYNKARTFYEKIGFTVIGEEDVDIGNNYFMNDYVMELPLKGGT
jgi:GNAT superfamily N-acetyltransferase